MRCSGESKSSGARSSDVGCICDCHRPGDTQTEVLVASLYVSKKYGKHQESPRDEFTSKKIRLRITPQHLMAPLPFSDPISRTTQAGLFLSYALTPPHALALNIKEPKISGKVEGGIDPSSSGLRLRLRLRLRPPHNDISLFRRQHDERPNFPVFAVGDESDHLATLCPNRREGILGPVGRPARPTILFHRGPFAHADGTVLTTDDRIDGQERRFLSGSRGQSAPAGA